MLAQLVRSIEPHRADEIAERLLTRFGSLARLLAASRQTLVQSIEAQSVAEVLPAAKAVVLEASRQEVQALTFDVRNPRFITYLTILLGHEPVEHLHVFFLDTYHRVIHDECLGTGGWSQVDVRMRELMRRAIDHNAANLVLVHNHPSGVPTPSDDDIALTLRAKEAAALLGISLADHLIVAGPKVFSMEKAGLL